MNAIVEGPKIDLILEINTFKVKVSVKVKLEVDLNFGKACYLSKTGMREVQSG
jgi:hypothetical protein